MVSWGFTGREKQTDRELNFAAEWQGQADLLNNLSRSDRDRLEANLRQTLGKKKGKKGASKKGATRGAARLPSPFRRVATGVSVLQLQGRGKGLFRRRVCVGFSEKPGGGGGD